MLLLFSHKLEKQQSEDAKKNWGVEYFVALPKPLQTLWSNIDPDLDSLEDVLSPLRAFIQENGREGDLVLIQGDFGASCLMASYVRQCGLVPVYATTKRVAEEYIKEGKRVKKSIFEHRRFRKYEY